MLVSCLLSFYLPTPHVVDVDHRVCVGQRAARAVVGGCRWVGDISSGSVPRHPSQAVTRVMSISPSAAVTTLS